MFSESELQYNVIFSAYYKCGLLGGALRIIWVSEHFVLIYDSRRLSLLFNGFGYFNRDCKKFLGELTPIKVKRQSCSCV
jgi:hypothetical protein